MSEAKYTARQLKEAARISTVTYTQWKARGFIKSKQESPGTGRPQLYTFSEVFRAAVLARLVSIGLSVSVADMHVNHLYGFKSGKAYLILQRSQEHTFDSAEVWGGISTVVSEAKLGAQLEKSDTSALVCLDKVEASVKAALSA